MNKMPTFAVTKKNDRFF